MKYLVDVQISVEAEDEDAAECVVNAALDNLCDSGDLRGHEVLGVITDTDHD